MFLSNPYISNKLYSKYYIFHVLVTKFLSQFFYYLLAYDHIYIYIHITSEGTIERETNLSIKRGELEENEKLLWVKFIKLIINKNQDMKENFENERKYKT